MASSVGGSTGMETQIMDFFKKKGHKPGPEQLGQPNVKEKEKIIDMSKDHMDV